MVFAQLKACILFVVVVVFFVYVVVYHCQMHCLLYVAREAHSLSQCRHGNQCLNHDEIMKYCDRCYGDDYQYKDVPQLVGWIMEYQPMDHMTSHEQYIILLTCVIKQDLLDGEAISE